MTQLVFALAAALALAACAVVCVGSADGLQQLDVSQRTGADVDSVRQRIASEPRP